MVRSKNYSGMFDSMKDALREIDQRHPIVLQRWAVEEVTSAYSTSGYYSQDIPEKSVRVSPLFDSREEADAWADEHEADEGKFLAVVEWTAREYTTVNWTKRRIRA